MELTNLTLTEAAELLAREEISPVELTQAHLARIERIDPLLNSYLTVTADLALEQARLEEAEIRRGQRRGPLHGVPLALKDLYGTAGVPTTGGSLFFQDHVPETNAPSVQRLFDAGAILLGKLNMHEIALGVTNVNPHYGACRNPWDRERMTGGSSGGSGAALAARLCLGSLGSDTGGSIRIPASLCGVVGLKPTRGRVSLRGVLPLSWNLDHAGPMARRVKDAAALLQVIAGYDPLDPYSLDVPVEDYSLHLKDGVRGWRVALADDEFYRSAEAEVTEAVNAAAEVYTELGAQVERVAFPAGYEAAQANGVMVTSDAAAFHYQRLQDEPDRFGADVLERLRTGAAYSSTEYILARHTQAELRRRSEAFFADYDLLLTATTPVTAPPIEGQDAIEQARRLTRFTAPFNLTGLPALSLPCGFTGAGLPVGLQLVSSPWSEARLLRAAWAYQEATSWNERSPALD